MVVPTTDILSTWATDPDNKEEDWEFVRELQRTDLPAGSFFVLLYPKGSRYHWILHEPDETQEKVAPAPDQAEPKKPRKGKGAK